MGQDVIIALILVVATFYVVWTFLPLRQRVRVLDALAARGLFTRFAARTRAQLLTPGCGNCSAAGDPAHFKRRG